VLTDKMITLENVWFSYENEHYVLKNISLSIGEGVTVIKGPNGSGKTTLLKIASLLLKPKKGHVIVEGTTFWNASRSVREKLRKKVVYVHEKPYLFKGTVYDNIAYPLKIRGYDLSRVVDVAKEFGVGKILNTNVNELSAGMRQLVALARAFVFKPKYVFLDEPLANLDDENKSRIIRIIEKYAKKGIAIVVATHMNINFRKEIVSKIAFMNNGVIVKVSKYK